MNKAGAEGAAAVSAGAEQAVAPTTGAAAVEQNGNTAGVNAPAPGEQQAAAAEGAAAAGEQNVNTGSEGEAGKEAAKAEAEGGEGEAEKGKDGEADKAKTGAPEKYADFVFPEGVTADPEAVTSFTELAKKLDLGQEEAQSLVDFQTGLAKKQAEAFEKAQLDAWEKTKEAWADQSRADKDIGGANLEAAVKRGRAVLDKYGSPELDQALEAIGAGNHPAFIKLLNNIGAAMEQGSIIVSSKPAEKPKGNAAQTLFPSMPNP